MYSTPKFLRINYYFRVLATGLCLCGWGTESTAQIGEFWGTSGNWTVFVDQDAGNGCFVETTAGEDVRIRVGYLPDRLGGFFSAASPSWFELKANTVQKISVLFDGALYAGEFEVFQDESYVGGSAFFNNPNFLKDFAKRNSMTLIGPDGDKETVNLKGSSRALKALDECQMAQSG